jgi:hypothetical protein
VLYTEKPHVLFETWYIILLQLLGCIFLAILSLPRCYITIASRLTVSFDASGAHLSASRPFAGPDGSLTEPYPPTFSQPSLLRSP